MTRARTAAIVPATLLSLTVAFAAAAQERATVPRPDSSTLVRFHLLGVALLSDLALNSGKGDYDLGPLYGPGVDLQLEGANRARVTWRLELALMAVRGDLDVTYDDWPSPHHWDESADVTVLQTGLGLRIRLLEHQRFDLHLTPMVYWQSFDVNTSGGWEIGELLGGVTYGVELGLDFRPSPGRSWFWTAALRALRVPQPSDPPSGTLLQLAVGMGRAL